MHYLGSGNHGNAYLLNDSVVLKITDDLSEVNVAFILKNKKLNYIANVYDVFKIKNKELYIILVEYLKPLTDYHVKLL